MTGAGHLFGSASLYKTASKKRKVTPTPAFDTVDNAYHAADTSFLSEGDSRTAPHASDPRTAKVSAALAGTAAETHSDHHLAEASASPSTASAAHVSRAAAYAHAAVDLPSEAYAGLSIENNESALEEGPGMNQGREDPLSLGSDDEQVAGSRATDTKRDTRSSSPAKRRASAMEDGHMDVEQSGSDARKAQTNGTSKSSSKQHTREASVDMLSGSGNSGSASTLPSSVSETPADEEMDDAEDIPSIDEQVLTILEEMGKDIEDGAKGYLVATAWINRVLARSSQKDDHGPFSKDVLEGDVGPIDNSPILLDRELLCGHR